MSTETETTNPKVELANKDWVMKELMDTERRIEKAFHEQTQFLSNKTDGVQQALSQKNDDLKKEITAQTRWMMGLTIAIIIAVLFKGTI